MRPSLASILALGGWAGLVSVICLLAAIKRPSMWIPAILSFMTVVSVVLWISSFRLRVADGFLIYTSPFRKTIAVRLEEIATAKVVVGSERYWDRLKPTVRLAITPNSQSSVKPFEVNLKVFRRKDVAFLLDQVFKQSEA